MSSDSLWTGNPKYAATPGFDSSSCVANPWWAPTYQQLWSPKLPPSSYVTFLLTSHPQGAQVQIQRVPLCHIKGAKRGDAAVRHWTLFLSFFSTSCRQAGGETVLHTLLVKKQAQNRRDGVQRNLTHQFVNQQCLPVDYHWAFREGREEREESWVREGHHQIKILRSLLGR